MTGRFALTRRLPDGYFDDALHTDVLKGLTGRPKTLPPKWFYDARGSELFEEITRLPEYYPTRAEHGILRERAGEIAAATGARTLVELGSGSSRKTRLLLDSLLRHGTLEHYAALDVSADALVAAGESLCRDYPDLEVTGCVTDLETDLGLPADARGPRLVAFLGGTLGNLDGEARPAFYARLRAELAPRDRLLMGVDLVKDPAVLVPAYDDAQGVTAEFDKNVLRVLNRELGAGFDLDAFRHRALWNPEEERIEMRLVSLRAQTVPLPVLEMSAEFEEGEETLTEIAVKFRRESLGAELSRAGFGLSHWWTDSEGRFALLLAEPSGTGGP
ncbi:histidine N-alpha-methyltransferase [Streptomyces daqingensis]|jgi:L-histidine N-alpha-methyltransferase|uniref:Histidine N-alpha-methyltransferase n=1 Tax=Streptomyces daqingensis TaxID=1472640 RepID=A0ABQ2LUS2_9ACTN|nr:L-histidine N(alpha)-methyltransferase [Streptomyces daqingensis]GGO43393.1 histidine N-alpha-methyltransferase [Streptomyces daqingensis]